jgi:hypothetical protein
MRNLKFIAALAAVSAGAAVAQIETTSASTYFLDVDPGRYTGPGGQRIAVLVGDQPRQVRLSAQDEICVQLQRTDAAGAELKAHVRVLRPEPHDLAVVRVAGADISPGTFRSTPFGMLLRVLPVKAVDAASQSPAVGTGNAPTCVL